MHACAASSRCMYEQECIAWMVLRLHTVRTADQLWWYAAVPGV